MSHAATILGVRVVSAGSGGAQAVDVALDENGVIQDIRPARTDSGRYLVPPLVDLHLDVLSERRRPRATVELGIPEMLLDLDAECAGAGIGTVCVGARFEDEPGRGIRLEDAIAVCRAVE
jgi:alpha-D-ribose 1-methylphosphonate 5-triphosphate diphosphatase